MVKSSPVKLSILIAILICRCASKKFEGRKAAIKQKICSDKQKKHCEILNQTDPVFENGPVCERIWDGVSCWPPTPANQTAMLPCSICLKVANKDAKAYKYCTSQGQWWMRPNTTAPYANYSECSKEWSKKKFGSPYLTTQLEIIRIVCIVGYSLSFVSLVLAVAVMSYFRHLRCQRNTVHVNLFASFILQGGLFLLRQILWYGGPGLLFKWDCKLFMTIIFYSVGANSVWIFSEGLYLHLLIFSNSFTDKSKLRWFVISAWLAPLLFIIPWVMAKKFFDDEECWQTHGNVGVLWIINAPIVAMILINLVFFVRIIHVLFVKLRASCTTDNATKYKKLAKAILVLFLLFGVHYVFFVAITFRIRDELLVAKFYISKVSRSIQGFFVSLLFCFLNSDVQLEIKKFFKRMRDGHYTQSSVRRPSNASKNRSVNPRSNIEIEVQQPGEVELLKRIMQNRLNGFSPSLSSSNSKANDESVNSDHNDNNIDLTCDAAKKSVFGETDPMIKTPTSMSSGCTAHLE